MALNGFDLNGADLNGGIASVTGAPSGRWYQVDLTAKTDFTNFVAFVGGASGTRLFANQPANTYVRVGFRFTNGGSVLNFNGTPESGSGDWQTWNGDPLNLMSPAQLEAAATSIWTKVGAFNPAAPYFQYIILLRTDDPYVVPSVTLAQIAYVQGGAAQLVTVIPLVTECPVPGGDDLPAGLYLFDVVNGYRLEDGATDNGRAVVFEFTTQAEPRNLGDRGIYKAAWIEIEATAPATVTVTPILDKRPYPAIVVPVTAGSRLYRVNLPVDSPALAVQLRVSWSASGVVVRLVKFAAEVSGETQS